MFKKKVGRNIRDHLREALKAQNILSRNNLNKAEDQWVEKKDIFFSTVKHLGLSIVPQLKDSTSGFLIFTFSGSIIAFSPTQSDVRSAVYFNTGIKGTGPKNRIFDNIKIISPVKEGCELILEGDLKRTSCIYHLAVFPEDVGNEVQKRTLFSFSGTSKPGENHIISSSEK